MDFSNPDLKELACLIYETLKNSGINAVLVGGACISIYSHNRYQSFDLDFATYEEMKPIEKALAKLEPIQVKFFVEFLDYFGRFFALLTGAISTFEYGPRKKSEKSAQKNRKID